MKRVFRVGMVLLAVLFAQAVQAVSLTVNIEGLEQKLHDHVATYLDIFHAQGDDKLTLARLQRLHAQAPGQIRIALQVYGYYAPHIQAELKQQDDVWIASYIIDPGTPIRIGAVNLQVDGEGRDNPVIKKALADFPVAKGQVFIHPKYDQARDSLYRTAIAQGFLDAQFTRREARVDLPNYTVTIQLHLQTGKRYYFGPVSFVQNVMDETFLRRYLTFNPGDPYNPDTLLKLQAALSDSGLYQTVEVSPNKAKAVANRVPIVLTLTGRKRTQWRFGLGYATDTGARGSIDYNHIVGHKGDTFESRLLESQTKKSISAGYRIPLADPVKEHLSYSAHYSDEIVEGRESLISGLSVSRTSTLVNNWVRLMSLNYDREVYTIGGEPEATGRALYPVFSLSRIKADNRIYTHNGYRMYFEVRGGNKNLLSDTNYAQLRAGLKWIDGINNNSRLLLRGDFGSTNVAYLSELPLSQRFFAGGDNSVRGYAYNELGPKDSFGNVVGGKHLLVGSIEYEHRLEGNWSAAVFYDVGNAINSMGDKLARGTGFGLRWNSPVGPIRFDFAWALDKPSDRFRLHIVIGPDL